MDKVRMFTHLRLNHSLADNSSGRQFALTISLYEILKSLGCESSCFFYIFLHRLEDFGVPIITSLMYVKEKNVRCNTCVCW